MCGSNGCPRPAEVGVRTLSGPSPAGLIDEFAERGIFRFVKILGISALYGALGLILAAAAYIAMFVLTRVIA